MQTVAMKPKKAEWRAMVIGLAALCAVMLFVPALCVPLAIACPLLACPLVGRREEPAAWAAAAFPATASLLAGYNALYSVSLVLIGLLPVLITRFVPLKKRPGAAGMLMYLCSMAASLTVVLAAATYMFGKPLPYALAETFVQWVAGLDNRHALLQQLAMNGLLSLPEGYTAQSITRPLMETVYTQQMLMSLRLTVENLLMQNLPSLFVQSCMLVGLFVPLRLERMNGVLLIVETRTAADKRTRVIAPPSFRLLAMPRSLRGLAFVLAIASLMLMMSASDLAWTIGQLCYAAFETMFYLLGAAVVVFLYTRNDPDRKGIAGAVAALMYIIAPFVLFLIGLADQTFHFRNPQAPKPDEK